MTQHNIARVYSIMQELQQLRDKARKLSEKNVELAKALTATKQELTKARVAQNAVFSNKVLKWMEAKHKPMKVQHQAVQCNFQEPDQGTRAFEENEQQTSGLLRSPCRAGSTVVSTLDLHLSAAVEHKMEIGFTEFRQGTAADMIDRRTENDESLVKNEANDNDLVVERATGSKNSTKQDSCRDRANKQQHTLPFLVDPNAEQTSSQAGVMRRLRHRDASVSYVESKLNTKLRRGDYYGLGKRTGQQMNTRRVVKHRAVSEPRRANSTFTSGPFGQQLSPFRSRRTVRATSSPSPLMCDLLKASTLDQDNAGWHDEHQHYACQFQPKIAALLYHEHLIAQVRRKVTHDLAFMSLVAICHEHVRSQECL